MYGRNETIAKVLRVKVSGLSVLFAVARKKLK